MAICQVIAGLLAMAALAGPVPPKGCEGEVLAREDRFTGERIVELKAPLPASLEEPALVARATITAEGSAVYTVGFQRAGWEWRYASCRRLHLLVDGEAFGGAAAHVGQVAPRGWVHESLGLTLTEEQAARLGKAQRIEYQACEDEFEASPAVVCGFRTWWATVEGRETKP